MPLFGSSSHVLDRKPELTTVTNNEEVELGALGSFDTETNGTPRDQLDTEINGTPRDQRDMARLGRKQELKVSTHSVSRFCWSELTSTSATSSSSQSLASVSQPFL